MSELFLHTVESAALGLLFGGSAVLLSRQKVLIQRWMVWLALFLIFGTAVWFQVMTNNRVPLVLLSVAIGLRMLGEYRRMTSLRAMFNPLVLVWLIGLPLIWSLTNASNFFALFLLVAAFDIGGWVGGHSPLNRGQLARKLAPKISPNKTYAGLLGSVILVTAVNFGLGWLDPVRLIALCLLAVAGDLLESRVKRKAGVKDAGRILPGFGGLLDRFDSLLLAGLLLVTL